MLTTSTHLDLALEYADILLIELIEAKRSGEFFGYPTWHLQRIDLIKRAAAQLRRRIAEDAADNGQEELSFTD